MKRVSVPLALCGLVSCCLLYTCDATGTISEFFDQLRSGNATDLILLMDRSASVGALTFLTREKPLLSSLLLYHVNMAPNQTRIAVVTFASSPSIIFDGITGQPVEKCDLFEDMMWNNRVTFDQNPEENANNLIDLAFQKALDIFLNSTRNDTKKILLTTTEGSYQTNNYPRQVIHAMDTLGVTRYVIGVGDWMTNQFEIGVLASGSASGSLYASAGVWGQTAAALQPILGTVNSTYGSTPTDLATCPGQISLCNQQLGYSQCPCHINGVPCGQAEPTSCDPDPCRNGATCFLGLDSVVCRCAPGFEGRICERNPDDCSPGVCGYNGTCVDGLNHYTCDCRGTNHCGDTCMETDCQVTPTAPAPPPRTTDGKGESVFDQYQILIIASPVVVILLILVGSGVYCCTHWKDGKIKKAVVRRISTIRESRPLSRLYQPRSPGQPRTGMASERVPEHTVSMDQVERSAQRGATMPVHTPATYGNVENGEPGSRVKDPGSHVPASTTQRAATLPAGTIYGNVDNDVQGSRMNGPSPDVSDRAGQDSDPMPLAIYGNVENEAPDSSLTDPGPDVSASALQDSDPAIYGNVENDAPVRPPLPTRPAPVPNKPTLPVKPTPKPKPSPPQPKPKPSPPQSKPIPSPPQSQPPQNSMAALLADAIKRKKSGEVESAPLKTTVAPPASRPPMPEEVAKEMGHVEPQTYGNVPLNSKMNSWLTYVCDVMDEGHLEQLYIVHFDGHMWITTERRFQLNTEQRQAPLEHLRNRSQDPIKLFGRQYTVINNDGNIAALSGDKGLLTIGMSNTFLIVVASSVAPQSLLRFEVEAVRGHLMSEGT